MQGNQGRFGVMSVLMGKTIRDSVLIRKQQWSGMGGRLKEWTLPGLRQLKEGNGAAEMGYMKH